MPRGLVDRTNLAFTLNEMGHGRMWHIFPGSLWLSCVGADRCGGRGGGREVQKQAHHLRGNCKNATREDVSLVRSDHAGSSEKR